MRIRIPVTALILALFLAGLVLAPLGSTTPAQAAPNDPAVILSTPYTSIIAAKGKDIAFPITVVNRGQSDEIANLTVGSVPDGWQAFLKDKDKGFVIRSVFLTAGMTQTVTFQAKAPADVAPGDYKFALQSVTNSGIRHNLDLTVGVQASALAGIHMVTYYPLLRGPSTSSFDFNVDLVNDSDDERYVGITTEQPQDWKVSMRPSGESKDITSLQLKGGETKTVAVTVNPGTKAAAGQYPIGMTATSGNYKDSLKVTVELLGSYELSMTTDTGLLNATATAGGSTATTLKVTNKGSAELKDVSLTASKPEGWEAVFTPDRLDVLGPGQTRDVALTIKPSAKALAGDYQLTFTATGGSASSNVQIRTTVETPTTWGWISMGVVVVVVLGLVGVFTRVGRR